MYIYNTKLFKNNNFQIEESTEESFTAITQEHFDILNVIGAFSLTRGYASKQTLIECIILYDRIKLPREAREQ